MNMKKISLILLVAMFAACSNATKEENKTIETNIFVEQKLDEFIKTYPDWGKDETTQEATTDKFKHTVINWSNEPQFLENMPLQLKNMRDTTLSGANLKVATFVGYNDNNRKMGSLLNYIQLQINGIVPDDLAKDLQVNKNYTLTGQLYKQGKRVDVKYIEVAEFKGYDLGKYTFSITTAKPIK